MPNKAKLPKRQEIFKDHRIAQIWGVKDYEILINQTKLLEKMQQIAKILELTVVNAFVHKFEPHGLSAVLVIAESHFAVHTWPEEHYLHIDLFTCSPKTNIKVLKSILKKEIPGSRISVGKVQYEI